MTQPRARAADEVSMAHPHLSSTLRLGEERKVIILTSCRACGTPFPRPKIVHSQNDGRCAPCEQTAATFRTNLSEAETQA